MTNQKKEQLRKQWLVLNPGASPEQFETVYPQLQELLHDEQTNQADETQKRNETENTLKKRWGN